MGDALFHSISILPYFGFSYFVRLGEFSKRATLITHGPKLTLLLFSRLGMPCREHVQLLNDLQVQQLCL